EAPFVKVEATKFTEVGYVGRDVESMVRDLMENAIQIVEKQKRSDVYAKAYETALERLSKVMRPGTKKAKPKQEGMNDWQNMFKNLGMPLPEIQEEEVEEVTAEIAKSRA
ncbi:MAG TPA: HslU--HslV peptidase ATPase subunit, partial [Trichococcus flocculiformis]|nr:HslU--HslV peptidase ATPase subunit [Trichococcus flocculiformis]